MATRGCWKKAGRAHQESYEGKKYLDDALPGSRVYDARQGHFLVREYQRRVGRGNIYLQTRSLVRQVHHAGCGAPGSK